MTFRVIPGGRGEGAAPGLLVVGAAEVVTMAGGLRTGSGQAEVGRMTAADAGGPESPAAPVVAAWDGRVVAAGPRTDVERFVEGEGYPLGRFARLDALGGTVTPGLVDPHTHLLFAGSREDELELRQRGAGYMEILAAGGGILSTVARTRAATADELRAHGRRWLDEMLSHGTTTIEAKSGYGLDLQTELRLLEVAHELGQAGPIDVVPTYLGAHAVPPEFRDRPDGAEAYVRSVIEEQLPGDRRPGPRPVLRRLLRGGRVHGRPVASGSCRPRCRWASRRGCTPTSSCRPAAPSSRPRSGRHRRTTSRPRRRPASTRSPRRPTTADRSWRRCCRRRRGS